MRVVYHPAVQRDVNRVLRRYDQISARLGDVFLEELHVTATTAFPDVNARGPEDWVLLLQFDSDSEAGMSWADEGRLYCWIAKRELAAGDFRRAWFMLQSY